MTESAATVREQFPRVRQFTEQLCAPIATEDYVVQAMPDCSPAKWHLAHTTWFFETFVLARDSGYRGFDASGSYEYLFNSYYNQIGPQFPRFNRGLLARPGVSEVHRYRRYVDEHLMAMLDSEERAASAAEVITLGLHHEQQHQELILADLKYLYSLVPPALRPAYPSCPPPHSENACPLTWIEFQEDIRWIGHDCASFAFDNEMPRHRVLVPAFQLAARPVTNGEYLEFIEDRGYERAELWLADGWQTIRDLGWRAPLYWELADGAWRMMTLGGTRAVDPNEPVCHASFFEADAYARWAGARLPTEAEWEIAACPLPLSGNFAEERYLHPVAGHPVAGPSGEGRAPVKMFGDVWEWTSSPYGAYPGYRPPSGALGEYNGKFMNGQYVLRGGSCFTPRSHIRPTYRNFFQPDKRWQMTGIRLAR